MDLDIRVTPRAGRSRITGVREGVVQIKLAAAPVDGAANSELIDLLSRTLEIPKRDITIVSGEHSRSKRVRVASMDREQVLTLIARLEAGQ